MYTYVSLCTCISCLYSQLVGESWLSVKEFQPTVPVFKAGHPSVSPFFPSYYPFSHIYCFSVLCTISVAGCLMRWVTCLTSSHYIWMETLSRLYDETLYRWVNWRQGSGCLRNIQYYLVPESCMEATEALQHFTGRFE